MNLDLSGEARLDESTLIRHAANGNAAAWEPLVLAHQDAVFRLAYLILGDPDDASDIAQEAFLRAWNHIKRFDATRPLRPWLLSIVANLARNRHRSAGRYLATLTRAFRNEPAPANIEEKSARHLEASELWKAVQTPEVLEIAEGTVKSRLSRALERLRGIIQQEFPVLAEGHEGHDA
jgi:RNA polymerase sigma-70 factor (ECF subfamily)